jgi:hypothetical protein
VVQLDIPEASRGAAVHLLAKSSVAKRSPRS